MRTIISSVVILIVAVLETAGVSIPIGDRDGLVNFLVIVVAALTAIYTRYTATRNLQTGGLLTPAATAAPAESIIKGAP